VRAWAAVNLAAIERNCARLAAAGPRLCAVVKADAYGHGAVPAARAALAGGASWLATATAVEAVGLRRAGIEAPILVMGALTREETELAVAAGADVVAWTEQLIDWVAACGGGRVHVKLDTGMGRLGTRDVDLADRLVERGEAAAGVSLIGAMTHFATADEPGDAFFDEQLGRFAAWEATVLGVVPIGYGDGWRRALTNNADVVIGGRRYPSVGTVSMDNITVDLGSGGEVRAGAEVALIGGGILVEELARRLGTINYEITCGLLGRVPRVYHRDGVAAPDVGPASGGGWR
jgi:alanine racemase